MKKILSIFIIISILCTISFDAIADSQVSIIQLKNTVECTSKIEFSEEKNSSGEILFNGTDKYHISFSGIANNNATIRFLKYSIRVRPNQLSYFEDLSYASLENVVLHPSGSTPIYRMALASQLMNYADIMILLDGGKDYDEEHELDMLKTLLAAREEEQVVGNWVYSIEIIEENDDGSGTIAITAEYKE